MSAHWRVLPLHAAPITNITAASSGGAVVMGSTRKMLETSAIEFLRKNRALLPRYALPQMDGSKH